MSVEEAAELLLAAIRSKEALDQIKFDKIKDAIDQLNWSWESWLENLPREEI